MNDADSALAEWNKYDSDDEPTYYAHERDKSTLYARIDGRAYIETSLSSEKTGLKVFFIKRPDISLLENVNNFPMDIFYIVVFRDVHKELWPEIRDGKPEQLGWKSLFDDVTAPKLKKAGSNNILLQRSTSPAYRYLIRLPSPYGELDEELREKSVIFSGLPADIRT